MSELMRLPRLDSEPKGASAFSSKYSQIGAPPSYRSAPNSFEDDTSSALWSENSNSSSAIGKRRSSWTNLIESDQNLKRYDPNIYPKVSSSVQSLQKVCVFPAGVSSPSSRVSDVSQFQKAPFQANYQQSFTETASVASSFAGPYPLALPVLYAPSQQTIMSEYTHYPHNYVKKLNQGVPRPPSLEGTGQPRPKRDRMESLRQFCAKPCSKLIFLLLLLLIIAAVIIAIVLSQTLTPKNHFKFSWLAPDLLRQNDRTPNAVTVDIDGNQVKMDLSGAAPFKGSYRSVLDFKTNRVAIMDASLKKEGNYSTCFVMNLDRHNIPDIAALQKAGKNAEEISKQKQGWAEAWNYIPQPLSNVQPNNLFNPPVPECADARWIQLNYAVTNQKSAKCTNCFDFCLPEYGIEKEFGADTSYLNIVKRICFHMFVPEWREYAQDYSAGQNQGAIGFGANINSTTNALGQSMQQAGQELQSKWISLQTIPQRVANASQQFVGSLQQAVGQGFNQQAQRLNQGNPLAFGYHNNQQENRILMQGQDNYQLQQPESTQQVGPQYVGQQNGNDQHSNYGIFNQPSPNGQQQQGVPPNGQQQGLPVHTLFPQSPDQMTQQPSNPNQQMVTEHPQGSPHQGREPSQMNGVNGHNSASYMNQAQFGGRTNYQPQATVVNPQNPNDFGNGNSFGSLESKRFALHPQASFAQPQWINVG